MNPKIQKIRELTQALYEEPGKGTGCCLHIVTDDGNIEDSHVNLCVCQAEEKGHTDCLALAKMYRKLTVDARAVVLNMAWCPKCEDYFMGIVCPECNSPLVPILEE